VSAEKHPISEVFLENRCHCSLFSEIPDGGWHCRWRSMMRNSGLVGSAVQRMISWHATLAKNLSRKHRG